MKRFQILLVFLFLSIILYGQTNKRNKIIANSAIFGFSAGSQIALYNVWYKEYQNGSFHFFNDSQEWGYMDKFGHVYSAFQISNNLHKLYMSVGYSKKESIYLSSAVGFLYQLNIEIMDGFSDGWGFSLSDLFSNSVGIAMHCFSNSFSAPFLFPKFSYSPTPYAAIRPNILGEKSIARILKDYNGQTYWLSICTNKFLPSSPKWLLFSVGYSVNERLVGSATHYENGSEVYSAYPQYLFSLDFDLSKIPVKNKFLKTTFGLLNTIKVPFPALGYEKRAFKIYPIYF